MSRLTQLRAVESKLTMALSQARQRLHELRRLDESSDEYRSGLHIQRDRLGLSAWIRDLASEHPAAVLEPSEAGRARVEQLCQALEGIELRLRSYPEVAESLGKETLRQRESIDNLLDELAAVRMEVRALEGQSDAAKASTTRSEEISRFLGRLQEAYGCTLPPTLLLI